MRDAPTMPSARVSSADRPKAPEGEAATIATSRVAEAEVAAQVARILPEPERLEPVDA
jgi:hypothetical protein